MRVGLRLVAAWSAVLLAAGSTRAEPADCLDAAMAHVRPIDRDQLNARLRALPAEQRELVALYVRAARRTVLDVADGCYPDTGFREHYRNLAERAKGAAVLAAFKGLWPEEFRRHCRNEAKRYLGEIAAEFNRHPNFQYEWQAAFWAAEAGIAAWFLWDDLDPDLRATAARMVAFQADRFVGARPATAVRGNTEAETVAWNSTICTLAVNMMPSHPRHADWEQAARTYLYNTFSTSADLEDDTPGDDGRPVRKWIAGPNLHEDFGLENHDMFHVDYLFACYRFHVQGAVLYWLAGRELPAAFRHHARDVYENVMLPCTNHEGFFVYVSDNDWKRYHNWTESCLVHAYMARLVNHPSSRLLEEKAASHAARYWSSFPADFSYDNPYVCGKPWTSRIADLVLMHVLQPDRESEPGTQPAAAGGSPGTFELKSAGLLTHRSSEGSFRSVCRGKGNTWVRFVAPSNESWLMLPVAANYAGRIDGRSLLSGGDLRSARGPDWFWMIRQDPARGTSEVFASFPNEIVLFMEYAPAGVLPAGCVVRNTVGMEKPHRRLTVHYQDGQADFECGQKNWLHRDGSAGLALQGQWVNIDGRMGLRFVVPAGSASPELRLPDPGARSALQALTTTRESRDRALAIVICPNRDARQTAAIEPVLQVDRIARSVRCSVGSYHVIANFGSQPLTESPRKAGSPGTVISPRTCAAWLASGTRVF